jgi:acyl-CoA thioester hydrolase
MPSAAPVNAFAMPITVDQAAIDMQGHASNVEVLRWISRAAWAHSRALGWDEQAYRRLGAWFVVRRHEIDYLTSAQLGDELIVHTWPSAAGKASAERRHLIVRPADCAIIARALNVWALGDIVTGRPRRRPAELKASFNPAHFL